MRNILTKIAKLSMISLLLAAQASANTLYMKNNDNVRVDIAVEPTGGTTVAGSPAVKQVLKPGEEVTLTLNKELLDNTGTFVVRGTVAVPSLYNICGPLSVYKDYKIAFVGGDQGTVVCTYEEAN